MIAQLESKPFMQDTFDRKVDYHQKKIDENKAEFLYSSFFAPNLSDFKQDCDMVLTRNSRVSLPYNEVSINLPVGEVISNELFLTIANEYMRQLGYSDASYAIIKHNDKNHSHLHILFTTIDKSGQKVDDSFLRLKSLKISRELEQKYNMRVTVYNKFNKQSLHEIKAREYYFDKALKNALNSYSSKAKIQDILNTNFPNFDVTASKTNLEYEILFGDYYSTIGEILEKGSHFNLLYKDELLKTMDRIYMNAATLSDFKNKLEDAGYYMRFVTEKGVSRYIYGVPDAALYFKDSSLPQKYRYGQLNLVQDNIMSADVQKHYIYNQAFIALNAAIHYDDFKYRMDQSGISVIESSNKRGVYGISFMMRDVTPEIIFKASDISRRLSYNSVSNFFSGTMDDQFPIQEITENKKMIAEMKETMVDNFSDFQHNYFEKDNEENNLSRKRKRKNNKGREL